MEMHMDTYMYLMYGHGDGHLEGRGRMMDAR